MAKSQNDPKCIRHARFASHLDRAHFDIIYWSLFVVVIVMLFTASFRYGRSIDDVANLTPGSPEYKRKMKRCMLVCSIYATISIVAVVMEVFALMALQFCDGEDLMALYWSTWTVMQIGSLIAIFGVLLAVFHTIRGRKHPPWALALGTPVLVVAGLGHIVQGALHKKVKSVRGRNSLSRSGTRGRSEDRATTTTETINAEDSEKDESEYQYSAKLLGYTPDGATILQFCPSSSSPLAPRLSPSAEARIIGTNVNGQVIVAFRGGGSKATSTVTKSEGKVIAFPEPAAAPPRRMSVTSVTVDELVVPTRKKTPSSITVAEPLPTRTSPSVKLEEPLARRDATPPVSCSESTTLADNSCPAGRKDCPPSAKVTRSDSPPGADVSCPTLNTPREAMSE